MTADRRRMLVSFAGQASRLVVREWAGSLGLSAPGLLAWGSALGVGLGLVLWQGAGALDPAGLPPVPFVAILVTVSVGLAGAFGIFTSWSAHALADTMRPLLRLPVPPPVLRFGVGFPSSMLAVVVLGSVLPAWVRVVSERTAHGVLHAVIVGVLTFAVGLWMGSLWVAVIRRVAERVLAPPVLLMVAYVSWGAVLFTSMRVFERVLVRPPLDIDPLVAATPLLWPALVDVATLPTFGSWTRALFVAILVRGMLALLRRGQSVRVDVGPARSRRSHDFDRRPWVRSHLVRFVRNGRMQEAMATAAILPLGLALFRFAVGDRIGGVAVSGLDVLLVLAASVTGIPGTFARSLSRRRLPLEQRLGLSPAGHVASLFAATLAVAIVLAVPLVALVATTDRESLAPVLATVVASAATCVAVGVAMVPSLQDGASSGAAVLVSYAAVAVVVAPFAESTVPGPWLLIPIVEVLAMLGAAVMVESRRRVPGGPGRSRFPSRQGEYA